MRAIIILLAAIAILGGCGGVSVVQELSGVGAYQSQPIPLAGHYSMDWAAEPMPGTAGCTFAAMAQLADGEAASLMGGDRVQAIQVALSGSNPFSGKTQLPRLIDAAWIVDVLGDCKWTLTIRKYFP